MKNIGIAEMITDQIHLFFISMIYGVCLGLWYEFFRAIRRCFIHKDKIVHLEDVIFCLSSAIGIFALFQIYNQGNVRFYCLLGIECGVLLYFFIGSELVGKLFYYLIKIFGKIIKKSGDVFFFPWKLIAKNAGEMLKNVRRTIRIIKEHK